MVYSISSTNYKKTARVFVPAGKQVDLESLVSVAEHLVNSLKRQVK